MCERANGRQMDGSRRARHGRRGGGGRGRRADGSGRVDRRGDRPHGGLCPRAWADRGGRGRGMAVGGGSRTVAGGRGRALRRAPDGGGRKRGAAVPSPAEEEAAGSAPFMPGMRAPPLCRSNGSRPCAACQRDPPMAPRPPCRSSTAAPPAMRARRYWRGFSAYSPPGRSGGLACRLGAVRCRPDSPRLADPPPLVDHAPHHRPCHALAAGLDMAELVPPRIVSASLETGQEAPARVMRPEILRHCRQAPAACPCAPTRRRRNKKAAGGPAPAPTRSHAPPASRGGAAARRGRPAALCTLRASHWQSPCRPWPRAACGRRRGFRRAAQARDAAQARRHEAATGGTGSSALRRAAAAQPACGTIG